MSVLEDIKREVEEISGERELSKDKAFGYWFLEEIEDLSPEEAEAAIIDGPWDLGRDALYFDEENESLKIYQFKYSEDIDYVLRGLTDVQEALIAERNSLIKIRLLKLIIVTIATDDGRISTQAKQVRRRVRTWLTRNNYRMEMDLETFDLKKFSQIFEKLYGLDLETSWRSRPISIDNKSVVGLMDVGGLKDYADREELLAFNIRKFLGLRKGSVNWSIKQTLEEENERDRFWVFNNGIVCLCTDFEPRGKKVRFNNFTVVNGAQTISTITKFLEANPTIDTPLWVLTKVFKVDESDIEFATKITKTSNTQTPTSNRDLRAVDILHKRIKDWLSDYFGITYIYRRGERARRGTESAKMKDIAQAYIAYWENLPNVAFARPGTIFADSARYETVFPIEEIDLIHREGDEKSIRNYLKQILIPQKILLKVRDFLGNKIKAEAEDKKWRSLAYHLLWIYKCTIDSSSVGLSIDRLYEKIGSIVDGTVNDFYRGLKDYCEIRKMDIPKDLKSEKLIDELRGADIFKMSYFKEGKEKIDKILTAS